MNVEVHGRQLLYIIILCWIPKVKLVCFLIQYPEVELLHHMIILFLFVCFWRKLYDIFHIAYANIFPQQCTRIHYSPYPHQLLWHVVFVMVVSLVGLKWYPIVVICIPLIISNVKHFVHVPIGHLYVFFRKIFIQGFCPFLNKVFVFGYWVV